MARVELDNRLGVPLHRVLFTGTSYTVEPPPTVPPNATVFWQTDDTGSVTYSAVPGGNDPSEMPTEPSSFAPTSPREALRPVTLAWEFSTTGRPKYSTQNVAAGLRAEVRERFDGALYMVSQANRKRAPIAPRRRRVLIGSSLLTGLLLLATVAGVSAYGLNNVSFVSNLFHPGTPHHPTPTSAPAVPQLVLAASQPNVPVGTTVTLSTTASLPIPSGYEVDIYITTSNQVVNSAPCSANCVESVVSAAPTSITYQASIEKGHLVDALSTSNSVTVTWVPPHTPTIRLTSLPAPDASGIVTVGVGARVLLTATTSLAVDTVQYQIDFYDTGGNRIGNSCTKGNTCSTTVTRSSAGSTTYVAYADPTKQGGTRVPSSKITVIWSAPSTVPDPQPDPRPDPQPDPIPNPPPTVSLSSSPAPDGSGNVRVVLWGSVALTATASSSLDNSGYHIAIFDTNGNQVSASCATGSVCSVTVTSTSAGSKSYIAHVVKDSSGSNVNNSTTIMVTWSNPSINLSVDTTSPVYAGNYTLTASASNSVNNSGYFIQLVDLTHGVSGVQNCYTGSSCAVTLACPAGAASIMYEAYIDQGNPYVWVATSAALTVTCPPLPSQIWLSSDYPSYVYGENAVLTATTDQSVTNTGYEIDIWDTYDNVPAGGGQCNTGTICHGVQAGPNFYVCITWVAYIDRGGDRSTAIAVSNQVQACWNPIIY